MALTLRACVLVGFAAGMLVGWPAVAAMTMVFRGERGQTITYHQEGSRVRVVNPTGTDDGEASIVDLNTTEHLLVYDDAKAYFDFYKALARARTEWVQASGARRRSLRQQLEAPASFRALNKTKVTFSGLAGLSPSS